jgi:hypothetical protein
VASSVEKAMAWPPRAPNSVTAKGMQWTYIGPTSQPFRVFIKLGLLNRAYNYFGRHGARNAEQTINHGIKDKF